MKPDLLSSDLTTTNGVNDCIEALKTTSLSELGKDALDQLGERIYSLPTDTQANAIKAVIECTETDKAIMREVVGRVAAKTRADKTAHQSQSKAYWRKIFNKFDMTLRRLRPLDPQVERRLVEIEEFWGIRTANRYMSLAPSILAHLAAIAEEVDHSVAVAYLNAEVLARKERKASGAKGKVSPGHDITPGDAKNAKAKIQDNEPVPVLPADLLTKHKLRVSKNTGLLKPAEEDESDEECDFDKFDEESGNGSEKEKSDGKNGGGDGQEQSEIDEGEDEKGGKSQDQSEAEPTHTSVKEQSEQEDAQESEEPDRLCVGDAEVHDQEQSNNAANEDENVKDENSMELSKAGSATCTGVKRQLEEQEDEQQSKRVRLSIGDTEVHDQKQSDNAANEDEGKKGGSGNVDIEADPSTCMSEKSIYQSVSDADAKELVKDEA